MSLSLAPAGAQPSRPSVTEIILIVLLGVVALAPIPFASNRPWAWEALGAVVGLLLIALSFHQLQRPENAPSFGPLRFPALLFAIAIGWAAIQCLSLTPDVWHHPLWTQAEETLGGKIRPSISVNRVASFARISRLITYAGIFWLSYSACRNSRRAQTVIKAVAMIVAVHSAWALAVYWSGNTTILWFEKWGYERDLTGTFVNRNSFATFTGLGLVACAALVIEAIRERLDFRESQRGLLKGALELLTIHARWLILPSLTIAAALLLTHSRGGAISTLLGLSALLGAIAAAPSLRARWQVIFGLGLVVALATILLISDNRTIERLADTSLADEGRATIFKQTIEAIHDVPWLGTGLGTFRDIFPQYRTEDLPFSVDKAHNDYLETILELGFPAAISLSLCIALLFGICLRGMMRRHRHAIFPCVGIGITVLVGSHSLVDFSLQMPAVTSLYWLMMGSAVAQSFNSPQSNG